MSQTSANDRKRGLPVYEGILSAIGNTPLVRLERINRVQELLNSIENSFWPNQYANISNSNAHYFTMEEIVGELGQVDYLFCATSTCGTIRGCAEYVRDNNLSTKIIAVDAVGSV